MLIVTFHNDSSGRMGVGNYNVTVQINARVLWTTRLTGHRRSMGWQKLVKEFAEVVDRSFIVKDKASGRIIETPDPSI